MPDLINRIDTMGMKSRPTKSGILSDGYFNGGGYIPSGDLRRDDYGVAAAYAVIPEVFAAMAVWENFLDGVTWIIKDVKTGNEIARTDQRIYPIGERGGLWHKAVKEFEQRYHHSYFKSIAFSDWLFGSTYLALLCADPKQYSALPQRYVGLKWLNPLNTYAQTTMGRIQYYQYSGMDAEGIYQIAPQDMAYRMNRRNPFDDLQGYSGILAAMDSINLSRNAIKTFKNFFSNGMQLGGVISPVSGDTWSGAEHESARREWSENHKGTANAGRWAILRRKAEITQFGQENASSNFTVTKDLRNTIFMALSVPPQLAGDPSDATYDNAKDIKRQWWETMAIPYAKDIAGYHNNVILPKLEPNSGVYIEADASAYETEEPDVIGQDLAAGVIDIATAQGKRGYAVDNEMKEIYIIGGRPMNKDVIKQLASSLPATEVQQYAQADKAQAEANAVASTPPAIEAPYNTIPKDVDIEGDKIVTASFDTVTKKLVEIKVTDAHNHEEHSHDLPAIADTPDIEALDELQAWRKFYSNGKSLKRPFEQVALRGDIGDAIQAALETHDKQTILDAFKSAHDKLSVKAIQATRLDFENDFDTLLGRARAEKMGRVQWASAMRSILRRYGQRAYVDGMADGGVEDDLSEDDKITINELHATNSGYVTELGNAIYKEDTVTDAMAQQKAAMWFNKSLMPYYQKGLESSAINAMFEWVYGDTEHCETCRRLNGQRHRLKGWKANIMPKSEDLECGGWLCDCNLIKVRGRERGNY